MLALLQVLQVQRPFVPEPEGKVAAEAKGYPQLILVVGLRKLSTITTDIPLPVCVAEHTSPLKRGRDKTPSNKTTNKRLKTDQAQRTTKELAGVVPGHGEGIELSDVSDVDQ
ncbi:MAG: hypothetical protein ACK5RK_10720 [Betaproteobacteria bacterium]